MAVKHQIIEKDEPQEKVPLTLILRALQSINTEHKLKGIDLAKFCENIVYSLGKIKIPTQPNDYLHFMIDIKNVQDILIQACSMEEAIFAALKAFYNGISDPHRQRQPTMAIVLQLINIEALPSAVKFILSSGSTESSLREALMTLCNWLSRWTFTPNLGPLILRFMQGLEIEQHYEILVEVTLKYVQHLFKLLVLPDSRPTIGPVVLYMLSSWQHSPEAFLKVVPHAPRVLQSLHKENTDSSQFYLEELVSLCVMLMNIFPDHEDSYGDLINAITPFTSILRNNHTINYKSWFNRSSMATPLRDPSKKVGLNNLGNTCYMNSVLQALFMTKLFRNDILLTSKQTLPLFSKLQVLFALLQYSHRRSLSPSEIFNLARPPGFQPGHQHDSSEFLGYLLDVLHEQERSMSCETSCVGDNAQTTVIQRSFGGRAITISRCAKCNTQSEHSDHFRELQLSFPSNCNNQSVQTLLDYYLQPEKLCGDNQYHCDTCQGLTDGERVTRIVEPPTRLVLTLKNFRYDLASQQRTKLLHHVNLDSFLQLGNINYELYAAVVHVGTTPDSGHYYTYAHDGQDWFKFNDCVVTRTSSEELCSVKPPETPYILFYSKQDCLDPDCLPRSSFSSVLEAALVKDSSELELEKMQKPVRSYNTNIDKRNDEPPPPGCGGNSFVNSNNRYVC